ncbi:PBECR2 nuclease fold domain-containing protein [Waltera sp.]|uniref:PBECR2 nuclease fold domain-containing protein n=2 Tax=Bacillota TaxID=1239 RepID=UPI003AF13C63
MYSIGKINQKIYKCITEDIITEEVIITENQIQHIKDRHPEAYNKVLKNIQETISTPDYIIRDKHAYTGLIIKRIQTEEGFLQIVLRLCTSGDEHGHKNSVISCWKISERRLQNYLRNKEILYSRE